MNDLIERQAAIELIKNYCENGCDIAEDNWCPSCQREQFIKLLKALPSAQLEPSEITDEQAILHLQSTGWMQNHDREMYESGLREQLADDGGSYDSLIPCEDAISRQAAIDKLDPLFESLAIDKIKALPSAGSSIPISWIEKYIDWLGGMKCGASESIAFHVSFMVQRWSKKFLS